MNDSVYPEGKPEDVAPAEEPQIPSPGAAPRFSIRKAYYLGAAAGAVLPIIMIIAKIIMCRYGVNNLGDILSAFGWCALTPAFAGAVLTAVAAGIGASVGRRADAKAGTTDRAARGGHTGLGVGVALSLMIGAIPALMILFPDC